MNSDISLNCKTITWLLGELETTCYDNFKSLSLTLQNNEQLICVNLFQLLLFNGNETHSKLEKNVYINSSCSIYKYIYFCL